MITHLGGINLGSTRAVQGLSKRSGFNFAKHDKPLSKASKQRLGAKLDEWRLSFEFNHHFCEPQATLEMIEGVCRKGEPVQLVFEYLKYIGWVTLDDIDINYSHIAPNGMPLIIKGTITLTEYVGETTPKPPAPAIRDTSKRLDYPVPIQTATAPDVSVLLPNERKQPMQHLEEALIAQHRARRLLRNIDSLNDGDISALNDSINTINLYITSDYAVANTNVLPMYDPTDSSELIMAMDEKTLFFAELTRATATRIF